MSKARNFLNQIREKKSSGVVKALDDLVWIIDLESSRLRNYGAMGAARDAIKGVKGYDPLTELKRLVQLIDDEDDLMTTYKEYDAAREVIAKEEG